MKIGRRAMIDHVIEVKLMTSNFVSSQPHRLHCFYNKRSAFSHGEESDDSTPVALGQQVRLSRSRGTSWHG